MISEINKILTVCKLNRHNLAECLFSVCRDDSMVLGQTPDSFYRAEIMQGSLEGWRKQKTNRRKELAGRLGIEKLAIAASFHFHHCVC